MSTEEMPKLKISSFEASVPVIQGGMGVAISLSGLAAAVANQGGIGVISATGIGMLEPDWRKNFMEANKRALRKELIKVRTLTKGVIGVNILVALSDYSDLMKVAIEENVDLIFLGAGLAMKGIPEDILKGSSTCIVPIVSSARTVNIIFDYWDRNYEIRPAAVVVEGPLAGGHLGFKKNQIDDPDFALEKLIPEVLESVRKYEEKWGVSIPVIAAGGVYTGEDILKYLKLGAAGVQMATRFVTTHECDASDEFKDAYIKSNAEDIVIIESPVGLPGRAIKNDFVDKVYNGIKKPFNCPWKCLRTCDITNSPYCIAIALHNARKGHLAEGFAFAGANAYRADKIISVKELFEELKVEYRHAQEK